jgi:hypothetical protein
MKEISVPFYSFHPIPSPFKEHLSSEALDVLIQHLRPYNRPTPIDPIILETPEILTLILSPTFCPGRQSSPCIRLKTRSKSPLTGRRSLFWMPFHNGVKPFCSPNKDMCFLSILIKRLILISPQIQRLAIVSNLLLGFDAVRCAWHVGATWHFHQLRVLAVAIATRTIEADEEHNCG